MSDTLLISEVVIARVRELRKKRGITALRLAELMTGGGYRTSRVAIAQAETGHRKEVSVDWTWAAARALDVPVKALLLGPDCFTCADSPAEGFTCNSCGRGNG